MERGPKEKGARPRNCWEMRGCGREIGGARVFDLGVCPAAIESRLEGINRGRYGGRACWAVAGTFCADDASALIDSCERCEVYLRVQAEEGHRFVSAPMLLALLR